MSRTPPITSRMTSDKSEKSTVDDPVIEISGDLTGDEETSKNDSQDEKTPSTTSVSDQSEPTDDKWDDLLGSGSIMKKILREGEAGTRPQRLHKCILNYDLKLADGTHVETQENFEIQLGDCDVVQGLDVALGLMNVNEKSAFKIEPRLAFGSIGLQPAIPQNTTVVYEVELVSATPEDDPETLSVLQRKEQGNKKRERGNWWYGRGENTLAIQCYRRALDFLDEVEGGIKYSTEETSEVTDSTLQNLLEDRISVCNNMAAAQIKLELYEAALNSLQTVLRCQPNNVKALYRKAKVLKAKNDMHAAMKCLNKANEVSPNNADVQREISSINKLIQKQKVTERELAKRMFQNEPKAAAKDESKSKIPKNNVLLWSATVAASVAVGLVGVAAYRLKLV